MAATVDEAHVVSPDAARVDHFTVDERAARGKAARAEVRRRVHAEWGPPPHRPDPVDLLEEQSQARVQELVPIRYGRMLVSPFTFFRGGAYLMASDLAGMRRTGLHVQLCGDAHLSNFGAFASPDRRLVFSINDFDETLPGPFEWDVKRLAASFAVAARSREFQATVREKIVLRAVRAYREWMQQAAESRNLDLWYARRDVEEFAEQWRKQASPKELKRFEANLAKTRTKDSTKALGKLTELVDGKRRIAADPPMVVPIEDVLGDRVGELEEVVRMVIRSYRTTLSGDRRRLLERFRYGHAARKVVGVGSVGTRSYILLLLGRDDDDPLFLQFKEAQSSMLEPFLGHSEFGNHGQRVVEGQRLTQAASDVMLGWIRTDGVDGVSRDFYVRQLWDAKGSAVVETMSPSVMTWYATMCGSELARGHARSGDAVAIAAYLGSSDAFDRALAVFAEAYADQNDRDYAALQAAEASGRVVAQTGV